MYSTKRLNYRTNNAKSGFTFLRCKELDVVIDLGVMRAVTTSDGRFFDLNIRKIKELGKKTARYQRKPELKKSLRMKSIEIRKA